MPLRYRRTKALRENTELLASKAACALRGEGWEVSEALFKQRSKKTEQDLQHVTNKNTLHLRKTRVSVTAVSRDARESLTGSHVTTTTTTTWLLLHSRWNGPYSVIMTIILVSLDSMLKWRERKTHLTAVGATFTWPQKLAPTDRLAARLCPSGSTCDETVHVGKFWMLRCAPLCVFCP